MYFLRLQTSIVWFLSLFSEGLLCMRQNFKLLCCAACIFWIQLSQFVCLVGRICGVRAYFQPNSVASAKIRLIRISAENMVQRAEFFEKSGWGVYLGPPRISESIRARKLKFYKRLGMVKYSFRVWILFC